LNNETADDSKLKNEIGNSYITIADLRRKADSAIERARVSGALQRFTAFASRYIDVLDLYRKNDPIELELRDLMIRVKSDEQRSDALWEIGSAENWVGYHLAAMLSLHEIFLELEKSSVPPFLMIDQPSQAYFPDVWPEDDIDENGPAPKRPRSADIDGVRRIFKAMELAVERTKHALQIIVVDHAGEITWRDIKFINFIGNWRTGIDDFLIPKAWLDATDSLPRPTKPDQVANEDTESAS